MLFQSYIGGSLHSRTCAVHLRNSLIRRSRNGEIYWLWAANAYSTRMRMYAFDEAPPALIAERAREAYRQEHPEAIARQYHAVCKANKPPEFPNEPLCNIAGMTDYVEYMEALNIYADYWEESGDTDKAEACRLAAIFPGQLCIDANDLEFRTPRTLYDSVKRWCGENNWPNCDAVAVAAVRAYSRWNPLRLIKDRPKIADRPTERWS